MRFRRKRRRDPEIAPDEIFLDSSNVSEFNQGRFEGRIEKPLPRSSFLLLWSGLALFFVVLIARAGNIQVLNGPAYAAESAHNNLEVTTLFAPRGVITDRAGVVLAENKIAEDGSVERFYPFPSLSQVIGYVSYPKKDTSGVYYSTTQSGLVGVELEYDARLTGTNGKLLTETDALGKVRSQGTVVPAKNGGTLTLSIDADLQERLEKAVADTAKDGGFIAGAGVIMDVHTGEVLSLVSYPSYDANVMASGGPASTIAAYNTDPGHPFLDHAVQGVYAPGSIVKPLVASGALTDGIITPTTIINDPGKLLVPDPYHVGKNFVYTGWKALGPVDVKKAIAWSSDIFFYTVGGGFGTQKGLGIDRLDYWYQQYGLGTTTGIDLPGEVGGLIPTPTWKEKVFNEPWYLGDTYFTAIGQYSMQVTPLQMARATAAVANGGQLLKPTLLANQVPTGTRVPVDTAALAVVRAGMRQGVTSALASAMNLPYVTPAAKTGTAQTGTKNQYDNSWIEGFFPYENPQYSFAVVLERGPAGAGEDAVNVMQKLFISLHNANSPYVGGTGTTSAIAL